MEVWAAIDLLDGRVVRLRQGNPSHRIVYPGTPQEYARRWATAGVTGLHVVDLDAALGTGHNHRMIHTILEHSTVPVQVAGGMRSLRTAKAWLAAGASRVVLATSLFETPDGLDRFLTALGPDQLLPAIDYRGHQLYLRGWRTPGSQTPATVIPQILARGVQAVLLTAIAEDGLLRGPDTSLLAQLPPELRSHIYAAGGIRSVEDVRRLAALGVRGVIIGRALYEGRLNAESVVAEARR